MSFQVSRSAVAFIFATGLTLLAVGVIGESMYSSGVPDGLTGAPGENSCLNCHSGTSAEGQMHLSGLPQYYDPGATYAVTVSLEEPDQQRWGFELTAVSSDGSAAGSFAVTDPVNTVLSDNPEPNRDYVKHTAAGTYDGTVGGPVTWQVDWTAPDSAIGQVTLYAAGVAANGDGGLGGDFTFLTSRATENRQVPSLTLVGAVLLMIALIITGIRFRGRRQVA